MRSAIIGFEVGPLDEKSAKVMPVKSGTTQGAVGGRSTGGSATAVGNGIGNLYYNPASLAAARAAAMAQIVLVVHDLAVQGMRRVAKQEWLRGSG